MAVEIPPKKTAGIKTCLLGHRSVSTPIGPLRKTRTNRLIDKRKPTLAKVIPTVSYWDGKTVYMAVSPNNDTPVAKLTIRRTRWLLFIAEYEQSFNGLAGIVSADSFAKNMSHG